MRDAPTEAAAAARAVAEEVGFARRVLRRAGVRLLLAFLCIALPLWGFGELADEVLDGEPLGFDEPVLHFMRSLASPGADGVFLVASALGYGWGVIPADIALVVVLTLRRRLRQATFAMVALVGSALLNIAAKQSFRRERPALWESIAPEATYSFPSAHAMGSATLAAVVVVLCWRTRYRLAVVVVAVAFVLLVGASRVYLGVHFPSDVLAGWAAACAWTAATALLVRTPPARALRR